MKTISRTLLASAVLLAFAAPARAGFIEVTVDARSGPWNWAPTGANSGYAYGPGIQDFLAPTVVDLASIGSGVGSDLFILYKSGLTSAFGGPPVVDQAGYVGLIFKDDVLGIIGQPFPSNYMPGNWGVNQTAYGVPVTDPENYGVFLQALVAALVDASGAVLNPFPIGHVIPSEDGMGGYFPANVIGLGFQVTTAGATHLQLGFNDDIFSDNTGALQVCVASSLADMDACIRGPQVVPEPASLALLGIGLAGLGALRRRKA